MSSVSLILLISLAVIGGSSGIRNGDLVDIKDHPYSAVLEINNAFIKLCTGAIISEHYVLTKESCAYAGAYNGGLVRVGSNWVGHGGSEHIIDKAIFPPDHSEIRRFALLRVEKHFKFDGACQPIRIFDQDEEFQPGETGIVAGFGEDKAGEPKRLHAISYVTTSQETCRDVFGQSGFYQRGMMCATTGENKDKDLCKDDDGAPFVIGGRLAGIVDSTWYKCEGKQPNLISNVTDLTDWIYEKIGCSSLKCKIGDEPSVQVIP